MNREDQVSFLLFLWLCIWLDGNESLAYTHSLPSLSSLSLFLVFFTTQMQTDALFVHFFPFQRTCAVLFICLLFSVWYICAAHGIIMTSSWLVLLHYGIQWHYFFPVIFNVEWQHFTCPGLGSHCEGKLWICVTRHIGRVSTQTYSHTHEIRCSSNGKRMTLTHRNQAAAAYYSCVFVLFMFILFIIKTTSSSYINDVGHCFDDYVPFWTMHWESERANGRGRDRGRSSLPLLLQEIPTEKENCIEREKQSLPQKVRSKRRKKLRKKGNESIRFRKLID